MVVDCHYCCPDNQVSLASCLVYHHHYFCSNFVEVLECVLIQVKKTNNNNYNNNNSNDKTCLPKVWSSQRSKDLSNQLISNPPNKSTSQILIKSISLWSFCPPIFNPYSPIRTRTLFWKGIVLGNKKRRERTPDFHHQLHSRQATPTDGPKLKKSLKSKLRAPRRFNEVFLTARQMHLNVL